MNEILRPVEGKPYRIGFDDGIWRTVYPIDGHLIGIPGYEEGFVNMIEAGTHNYAGCCGINFFLSNSYRVST